MRNPIWWCQGVFTADQPAADQPSLAAVRTDGEIHTGEGLQHFLPGFGLARGIKLLVLGFSHGSWGLEAEEGPGLLQFGFGIAGGHEAVVADFDKPGRAARAAESGG